ncbi:hypothetical protein BCR37DRAFT_384020 [Protomyces lactucae-debilis]|uniref:Uncharacterized protein n=1 Tax=Protomyces lactucae-debilis TaxID=2754530 RepID=A0A1Y2EV18_PROLT|nr:uncharacterized protein BCR37DRAFT_384020 [Protomyces lactucae-debilis]ORY75399.1 hypothetical protein BCR37DRAFT_384020 [Protomyces lactucae-debilis]
MALPNLRKIYASFDKDEDEQARAALFNLVGFISSIFAYNTLVKVMNRLSDSK